MTLLTIYICPSEKSAYESIKTFLLYLRGFSKWSRFHDQHYFLFFYRYVGFVQGWWKRSYWWVISNEQNNKQTKFQFVFAPVKSKQMTRGIIIITTIITGKPLTVFGLGEDRAVLRAAVQNHTRSKQVGAALELDAGFPAEFCHAVSSANYFHGGSVTLPLVPGVWSKVQQ